MSGIVIAAVDSKPEEVFSFWQTGSSRTAGQAAKQQKNKNKLKPGKPETVGFSLRKLKNLIDFTTLL